MLLVLFGLSLIWFEKVGIDVLLLSFGFKQICISDFPLTSFHSDSDSPFGITRMHPQTGCLQLSMGIEVSVFMSVIMLQCTCLPVYETRHLQEYVGSLSAQLIREVTCLYFFNTF